jgi:hypothetical protein
MFLRTSAGFAGSFRNVWATSAVCSMPTSKRPRLHWPSTFHGFGCYTRRRKERPTTAPLASGIYWEDTQKASGTGREPKPPGCTRLWKRRIWRESDGQAPSPLDDRYGPPVETEYSQELQRRIKRGITATFVFQHHLVVLLFRVKTSLRLSGPPIIRTPRHRDTGRSPFTKCCGKDRISAPASRPRVRECARAARGHVRHLVQTVLGDAPNEEA